jgi:hypothetical protein
MEVSGQFLALATFSPSERYPHRRLAGRTGGLDATEKRQNFLSLLGIEPRYLIHTANSLVGTNCAIIAPNRKELCGKCLGNKVTRKVLMGNTVN